MSEAEIPRPTFSHIAAVAMTSQKDRAVELLEKRGAMRRMELGDAGVHPETLARLVEKGLLTRVARGLYQLTDADITAPHDLAEVAKLVPKGVICLVSALQFHELTLQTPSRVWLAIGAKARKPRIDFPPIRVVRFGERALSLGVETHTVDGVPVPVFHPAKTVVDCFRFRKHVGFDVALEGLRNVMRSDKAKPAEIVRYARDIRIWSVMRPYLETVVADGA